MDKTFGASSVFLLFFLGFLVLPLSAEAPPKPENVARIHYYRQWEDFEGWGIHVWGLALALPREVTWSTPLMPEGRTEFGVYWDIKLRPEAAQLFFIIHLGEQKNSSKDVKVVFKTHGREVWVLQDDQEVYTSNPLAKAPPAETTPPVVTTPPIETKPPVVVTPPVEAKPPVVVTSPVETKPPVVPAPGDSTPPVVTTTPSLTDLPTGEPSSDKPATLDVPRAQDSFRLDIWFLVALVQAGFLLLLLVLVLRLNHSLKEKKRILEASYEEKVLEAESRLMKKSTLDELTALPNRAGLIQALHQAVARTQRYKRQLALIFIDLDRFKPINDSLGHEAGDFVLRTIAERFKESLRTNDLVARLGGDEFVVLIEDVQDVKYLAGVAQKLLSAAEKSFVLGDQELTVSASMGIATYPNDGKDASALLRNADAAMYKAKEKGKNGYQFYSEDLNTHSLERLALESSLRHALERHEMEVHFQPIVETETGLVHSMETLLRWKHPDLGYISPVQFIPIAEDNGLIESIGLWVLEQSCAYGQHWLSQGSDVRLTVNMSARQLKSAEILGEVRQVLENTLYPPSRLTLEITESMMMLNPEDSVVILETFKEMGLTIAMDDFGTGYSSLSYLKRFPIDIIKVDRSFLQGVPEDRESCELTSAVIAIGNKLQLKVVAEGVETKEQKEFLLDQKCQYSQGYLFSKPLPPDKVAHMWKKR